MMASVINGTHDNAYVEDVWHENYAGAPEREVAGLTRQHIVWQVRVVSRRTLSYNPPLERDFSYAVREDP